MEARQAARVGAAVLIGLGLFFAGWWYLSHGIYGWTHYPLYVVFKDTKGLATQTPVRMNGVNIGEVETIQLSDDPAHRLKPVVRLAIENRFRHRIPDDSTITITSGLLITNAQLEITPGASATTLAPGQTWPQDRVVEPASMLASLSPEADRALRMFNETVPELTRKLSRSMDTTEGILKRTDRMVANLERTTASVSRLASDPQIPRTMRKTLVTLDLVTADVLALSREARRTGTLLAAELRAAVRRNSRRVDELATSAVDILQNLGDTVEAARSALNLLSQQVSDPRLQQSIQETLDLAKTTVARFNQIASDIHQLTGDPTVQGDLKTTVANVRETSEQVKPLVQRVSDIVGALKPGAGPRLGIGAPQVAVDFLGRSRGPNFRADVNVRLPFGENRAAHVGLFDFSETYRLNAQYGIALTPRTEIRYGLYASKLGAGLDLRPGRSAQMSFDLYDPNSLRLDIRSAIQVNREYSLLLGVDSVFNRPTATLGVRLRP